MMPIVKKPNGWYSNGRGPFLTKQEAVQVITQNEEAMDKKMSEFICHLLECVRITHVLHLRTRSYAAHQALGEFYESLDDLVDTVAESYQGKYLQLIEFVEGEYQYSDSPIEYLSMVSDYVQTARHTLPQDSELQNEIDTIQTLVNSTIYKLRFLS